MKFLIIRLSSIGDIVLTTPVIRCLKQQVSTAELHYVTRKAFKPVLASNPYIDKLFYVEDSLESTIEELKKEDYDYIIDLHHNVRSLKIKKALGKQSFSFPKLNIEKWLLTALKINRLPDVHIVDRYLETVKSFGVKNDGRGLDYFIPEEEKVKEEDIPTAHHAGYIAIAIGAALNTKKLPVHKLRDLCQKLEFPLILLGGKEDVAAGQEIAQLDPVRIYNACGKFSLNESADLVRRARLLITHDTGLMHVGAAFNKPIVSIWGNTIPQLGMTAYYSNPTVKDIRMEVSGLRCRPCSKIGYAKCPKGHFKCMEMQDVDGIVRGAMG